MVAGRPRRLADTLRESLIVAGANHDIRHEPPEAASVTGKSSGFEFTLRCVRSPKDGWFHHAAN